MEAVVLARMRQRRPPRLGIVILRAGVGGASVMSRREGVQERVGIDRLSASTRESLSSFVGKAALAHAKQHPTRQRAMRGETVSAASGRRTELSKRSADAKETDGSRLGPA